MMRTMRWPVFAAVLLALLLHPVIAQAQHKWPGIMGTSRAIDWTNASLTATLPDGEMAPDPRTPPTLSTNWTRTISSFPEMSSTNPFADSTEDQ